MAAALRHGVHSGVPAELTTFIGRRRELTAAKQLLGNSRLVTLTGTGGVGKTRLAVRVVTDLRSGFTDGVAFVALAELHDPALVVHAIGDALGLWEQGCTPDLATLTAHLASRRTFLVLDNCEHLVDAVAGVTGTLLAACPQLTVLTTSRRVLGIDGESTLLVPSLSVPDSGGVAGPDALVHYESVALFLDRSRAAVPGFQLTADNYRAVAELCRRLDGIPLAVELTAVRLRALSVDDILTRLGERMLSLGSRRGPGRQRTLQASIEWSHALCTERERQVWAQLSVFTGSFDLAGARAVCGTDGADDDVVNAVIGLVDQSVLTRRRQRYRLLEPLREFGLTELRRTGDEALVRRRYRTWVFGEAKRFRADWHGTAQAEWIARLRDAHADLRAALEDGVHDDPVATLRALVDLENYWIVRGLLGEARQWLDRVLEAAVPEPPDHVRGMCVLALLAVLQSDGDAALDLLRRADDLLASSEDGHLGAVVATVRSLHVLFAGDPADALDHLEPALAVLLRERRVGETLRAQVIAALAAHVAGRADRRDELLDDCLARTAELGDSYHRSIALWVAALAAWQRGDLEDAARLTRDALRLRSTLDDQVGAAITYELLGWIAAEQGDRQRAAVLLGASEPFWRGSDTALTALPVLFAHRDRCEERLRSRLGSRTFTERYRHGQAMSAEDALAFALGEPAAATAEAQLTRREREIAELIARGLSNKQVAATLVIAQRTAEGHVENILRKLGFTSRTQVAAWVAAQQRPPLGPVSG